ncbi:hypothetical protein J3R30DRAFT_3624216 [Lentinula aciculospora]|uniref:BTB domain-containing protein n=1 Tax=Lentinula aciculospora TaxID=153920 RepID=A0A9W8ZT90_9AGAR|nr:hypothetical protein J3R30DRAFT_3624216 [Lentinula aciculospora]
MSNTNLIIHSSDNVGFHLHKKNLEFSASDEIVLLTGSSATLEIMFQFVYPQRYPDLHKLDFESVMLLAEAAEKYEVFALIVAMSILHEVISGRASQTHFGICSQT